MISTPPTPKMPTNQSKLKLKITQYLKLGEVRIPKEPEVIYQGFLMIQLVKPI